MDGASARGKMISRTPFALLTKMVRRSVRIDVATYIAAASASETDATGSGFGFDETFHGRPA